MDTTAPNYTQQQVNQALSACCSSHADLAMGCSHVVQELPGCPCDMLATAALTLFTLLDPATLVQGLTAAGYSPTEIARTIMLKYPGTSLDKLGDALAQGTKLAGGALTPLAWAQAISDGFTEAQASQPPPTFTPAVPTVATGPAPRWVVPFYDPRIGNVDVRLSTGAGGDVLLVNSGSWLSFRDPATGKIRALAEGVQFGKRMQIAGETVFLYDFGAGVLRSFALDGTPGWRATLPAGYAAVGDTHVFHQGFDDGAVTALDRVTGEVAWTVNLLHNQINYPAIAAGSGVVVYKTGVGRVGLQAISQQDGSEVWHWDENPDYQGRWVGNDDLVIADGTVFVPSQPIFHFLRASDGSEPIKVAANRQDNWAFSWAVEPSLKLVAIGWNSQVSFLVNYMGSEPMAYFPSLMGTSAPPDPNIYGPTVPFVLDPNTILFVFAAAGQAQVNRVTWQGWDWGMDLPGTEVISIAGYPAGKAVGATTLNLVLFTGDENMGWLAAMPLS